MGFRAQAGVIEMREVCIRSEPQPVSPTEEQKSREWASNVQDMAKELFDRSSERKNGLIDDFGYLAHCKTIKQNLDRLFRGVDC